LLLHFREDAGDPWVKVALDSAFQRMGITSEQAGLGS
jgi:hypothetical protein